MASPTPTLDAVLAAVQTEVSAIAGIGNVFAYESHYETEWELLRSYLNNTTGVLALTTISSDGVESVEGPATQEWYSIYAIRIRYYNISPNNADATKDALLEVEKIRDKVEGNAAIFAISGQRQLRTPETISTSESEMTTIPDLFGNPQQVFRATMSCHVEARRWA